MQKSNLRTLVGVGLGAFAGLSLVTGVYPFVAEKLLGLNSFATMIEIRPLIPALVLLWAICGGIVGWHGGVKIGVTTLGLCGILTGIVLGIFTGGGLTILIGILCGLVYGGLGGLIIGKAFIGPINETQ